MAAKGCIFKKGVLGFYLKLMALGLWLGFCSIIGFMKALLNWANPSVNQFFARLAGWGGLRILGISVQMYGLEHLEKGQPCIYIVNHQSAFDLFTFSQLYPDRTIVIGKKEISWIPLFGIFYWAGGNILIDRKKTDKAISGLNQVVDAVKNHKVSVWIFPEGTRNRQAQKGLLPFKRGAFHMAIQAGVPLVPVVSSSLEGLVDWKRRYLRSGRLYVKVLPPIETKGYTEQDAQFLCEQARERMNTAFFEMNQLC